MAPRLITEGADVDALDQAAKTFAEAVRVFRDKADPNVDDLRSADQLEASAVMQAIVALARQFDVAPFVFMLGVGGGIGCLTHQVAAGNVTRAGELMKALIVGIRDGGNDTAASEMKDALAESLRMMATQGEA